MVGYMSEYLREYVSEHEDERHWLMFHRPNDSILPRRSLGVTERMTQKQYSYLLHRDVLPLREHLHLVEYIVAIDQVAQVVDERDILIVRSDQLDHVPYAVDGGTPAMIAAASRPISLAPVLMHINEVLTHYNMRSKYTQYVLAVWLILEEEYGKHLIYEVGFVSMARRQQPVRPSSV
jgi:hypothetical protein